MPEIAHEEEDEEKSRRGGRRGRRRPARAAVWPDADCLASRASPLSQRLAPGHAPRHDLFPCFNARTALYRIPVFFFASVVY